ncbi:MAG: ABC transporter permease [Candidatus Latescibacterota bacterium]
MLFTICIREIREHLKSPAFLIGTVLVVFLTAYATVIAANDYRQRRDDCLTARKTMEVRAFRYFVFREPNPMSIFVQGYDTRAGAAANMNTGHIPVKTTGYMEVVGTSQAERAVAGFLPIDYAFVVRIVLSILVIFLVYDVIAGDRQRGTLKLMLANPVPRDSILLGKMLGGWCVVMALLTAASTVSLLLVLLSPGIPADSGLLLRFSGVFLVSVLYLTVFFALGLWISVLINRPSTVLLTLLVAWVILTSVYPALSSLSAARLIQPPGERQIRETHQAALKSLNEEYVRVVDAMIENPFKKTREERIRDRDRVNDVKERQAKLMYQAERVRTAAFDRQASLAVMLSMASPAAVYDQAVMQIAGVSSGDYDRFLEYLYRAWGEVCKANRMSLRDRKESAKILESIEPFHPGDIRPDLPKALLNTGILCFFSILFFALAWTGFLRKDVR